MTSRPDTSDHQLQAMLAVLDQWIDTLVDPELGSLKDSIVKKFKQTGCTEKFDDTVLFNATFNSFIYPPDEGQSSFTNGIVYGEASLENLEKVFSARCHEAIHAMQYAVAAVMHADPFNAATNIVLCPRDYVLRKELLERDAYAKGAWLCALAAEKNPDIIEAMKDLTLSVTVFRDIRQASKNLQQALQKAAYQAGTTEKLWIKGVDHKISTREAWNVQALAEYESIIKARLADNPKLVFVRMEESDILSIGDSFGPNPFGGTSVAPEFKNLTLSPENQKLLDKLNTQLGIHGEQSLPTLKEALQAQGLSHADLLAASAPKASPAISGKKPSPSISPKMQ